jgi:2-succinyl-6-hydroxy-2,4-cyclohexadiene-1-carboxylate synthase
VDLLHARTAGDPEGPAVALLHGFTQTGRLLGPLGAALGRTRRTVLVDLPGHGGSSSVTADLTAGAGLVVATVRAALGDPAARFDLLGYSLGARFALHVALGYPGAVDRLVLVGATAGIEDPDARAARRGRDERLADDLEATGDVAAFVQQWLRAPMFARLDAAAAGAAERLRNTPGGLASSLRLAGNGAQAPVWDRLGGMAPATLALAGAADPRFAAHAARLAAAVPAGVCTLVPGAGHAAHLEQPALTARVVTHWLEATSTRH